MRGPPTRRSSPGGRRGPVHRDQGATRRGRGGTQRPESVGVILGTALAGLAGDAVTAAGDALGSALESASRERTFSASASTIFDFYQIENADADRHLDVRVEPRLKPAGSLCLIMFMPAPARADAAAISALDSASTDTGQVVDEWERLGFGLTPGPLCLAELTAPCRRVRVRRSDHGTDAASERARQELRPKFSHILTPAAPTRRTRRETRSRSRASRSRAWDRARRPISPANVRSGSTSSRCAPRRGRRRR